MVLIIRLEKQYKLSRTMVMTRQRMWFVFIIGCIHHRMWFVFISFQSWLFVGVFRRIWGQCSPCRGPSVKHCWTGTQGGTEHPVLLGYCVYSLPWSWFYGYRCVVVRKSRMENFLVSFGIACSLVELWFYCVAVTLVVDLSFTVWGNFGQSIGRGQVVLSYMYQGSPVGIGYCPRVY